MCCWATARMSPPIALIPPPPTAALEAEADVLALAEDDASASFLLPPTEFREAGAEALAEALDDALASAARASRLASARSAAFSAAAALAEALADALASTACSAASVRPDDPLPALRRRHWQR